MDQVFNIAPPLCFGTPSFPLIPPLFLQIAAYDKGDPYTTVQEMIYSHIKLDLPVIN